MQRPANVAAGNRLRPAVVVILLVIGMPLSVVAPVASAVTWCTAVGPEGHACSDHVACLGRSRDPWTGTERCQYGIPSLP